jgi:predicted nucleic acid-binding Zn ribbon protein
MPTLVEFVCQRCGQRTERRAAVEFSVLRQCPKCDGHLQAMRTLSHRALRERMLAEKKMGGPPPSEGAE